MTEEYVDIKGRSQATLAISSVAAQTTAPGTGIYDVWADADCFVKVNPAANDVTTANGYPLFAGNVVPFFLRSDDKIGAITTGASSNLHYHQTGDA